MMRACILSGVLLSALFNSPLSWAESVAMPVIIEELSQEQVSEDALSSSEVEVVSAETLQANIIKQSGLIGLSFQARHVAQAIMNAQALPLGHQYRVASAVSAAWSPAQWQQHLQHSLADFTLDELMELEQLLSSDVLLESRQREEQAVSEQESTAFADYMRKLQRRQVVAGRQQVMSELNNMMRFSRLMAAARQTVYRALHDVVTDWQAPSDWPQQLEQQALNFLMYAHRSVPSPDLMLVIEAYQTPVMQRWMTNLVAESPPIVLPKASPDGA